MVQINRIKEPITGRKIVNRLSHLPELLRSLDESGEAENLDCLIEEIKQDLCKAPYKVGN